jgi:hypothetical protein
VPPRDVKIRRYSELAAGSRASAAWRRVSFMIGFAGTFE